jgi:putative cell wall-binding protein/predicted regulator of Ras-like GTPase activity (Roadblock/LC7/MglB family)
MAMMITLAALPAQALAAKLIAFEFVSSADACNLIAGETNSISFRLYDTDNALYSGSVTGYLWNTETGEKIALSLGGSGSYTASNVVVNKTGRYGLFVTDSNNVTLRGSEDIIVRNAVARVTSGSLGVNMSNTVSGVLEDTDGKILDNRSVTIDGSEVGASSQSSTTLADGTFTFSMTPSQTGTVKFIHAGHVVGLLEVADADVNLEISGSLVMNVNSRLQLRLTDREGEPIDNKNISVDATAAGLSTSAYTTLNDGTVSFMLTPTQLGTVKFIYAGQVIGLLEVADMNVVMDVSGRLIMNANSRLDVRLTDSGGEPIANKNISVDATEVGLSTSTYATLNDGTVSFMLTPTKKGPVHLIYGGRIIETVTVEAAYTQGARIGGEAADNAALSVAVAQKGWISAENVILTRDDLVADAMVAAPLSKKLDAPVLMTPVAELSAVVAAEIRDLGAKNVFIIGGTGAVSSATEAYLQEAGLKIVRFAGGDRYDTAAQVAAWMGNADTAYLAYGYGEPDALAASAFAAEQGAPILLTEARELPSVTRQALLNMGAKKIKLLGGTGVISSELENSLTHSYEVKRYGGADRFATEAAIFQAEFTDQSPLYFSSALVLSSDAPSGEPFGDSLLAAALAAKNHGVVLTLPPDSLPATISYFLIFNKGYIPEAVVIGNQKAISLALEEQLRTLLNH